MIRPSNSDKDSVRADHDRYVTKAIKLIHSPETRESVLKMLKGPNPVQRTADVVVGVMQRIDAAARKEGIEIHDSVKVMGANEILNLVIELGEAAKLIDLSKDLKELALSTAVQDYVKAEISAKRINQKALLVAIQRDIRSMPPKERKEIQKAQLRIQQTARKYNGGKQ